MSNLPICDTDTPDPWMLRHNNTFYLTFTAGDRVEIWASPSMEDFRSARKTVAWRPEPGTPWSTDLWAPELHLLQDTWYVYLCAAHPGQGNPSHRTVVLRCADDDPMDGEAWSFLGPLVGMPDHWNIDLTVFVVNSRLYACYSGWPLGDDSDTQQDLFVIELSTPETALYNTLTCVSRAELPWERPEGGRRGVNEGPTWLDVSGFRGIVYSANGSWTSDYTLGLLHFVGSDPLAPASWRKRPVSLLKSCRNKGPPFGPGHASFIPDGPRVFCIYHATEREDEGWNNRKARVLCLEPAHFHPQAESLCCSLAATPGRQNVFQPQRTAEQQPQQGRHLFRQVGDMLVNKFREYS